MHLHFIAKLKRMKQPTFRASIFFLSLHSSRSAFLPVHQFGYDQYSRLYIHSERARVEKNLEEMMGNDWRVFRATLVAREKVEFDEASSNVDNNIQNKNRVKQDRITSIITAFFQNNNQKEELSRKNKNIRGRSSIFDGHDVGGATTSSVIPPNCDDPFVSAAEIPVLMQPKVNIDKHRWAHPIPVVEPGCVLIANEKLGGVFHQTVVLIIEHHETVGSKGIVINRPIGQNLLKYAWETECNIDLSLKMAFKSAPVGYGGPVMKDEFTILHGFGEVEGSKKVAPGVFVGGSSELMNEVRQHNFSAKDALFIKGHAEWVPSQLSREISKGVWHIASCSTDFVFRYAGAPTTNKDNRNNLWSDILTCMDGKYKKISKQYSGIGDGCMMP